MGRFFASILFLAACGDNLQGGPGTHDPGGTNDGTGLTPQPRTEPAVCGFAQWTTVTAADPAMAVSVVHRGLGATVLAVPTTGGTMTGFAVDDRMTMMTDPAGTKVAIDDAFTNVSASVVDNRLVATAVDADSVRIALLSDDLTNPQQIAKLPGAFVAKPAFLSADHQTMVPVGGPDGLSVTTFDPTWSVVDTQLVVPTKPITGMAATQYGNAVLATWSTMSNQCYVGLLAAPSGGPTSQAAFACESPQIAADVAHGTAKIVFDAPGGIRIMHVAHTQMGGDSVLLRPDARSPRIVFDGTRYWVSYLDARGDVVIGFLDGNNQLVSMGLIGDRPMHDAYELVMVDNHPWVFSVDPTNGYQAHRMCVTTSW